MRVVDAEFRLVGAKSIVVREKKSRGIDNRALVHPWTPIRQSLIQTAAERIVAAMAIAVELGHDERLHLLAMKTVSVLEDALSRLKQTSG